MYASNASQSAFVSPVAYAAASFVAAAVKSVAHFAQAEGLAALHAAPEGGVGGVGGAGAGFPHFSSLFVFAFVQSLSVFTCSFLTHSPFPQRASSLLHPLIA
jgi:hypothetical protein